MKGFIEIPLILILLLIGPRLIELDQKIRSQIKLLSYKAKTTRAISDINFHLIKKFDYVSKNVISETIKHGELINIKNLKTDSGANKLVADSNRIFNWKKFISNSEKQDQCSYNNLEIHNDIFFNCAELKITNLKTRAKLASSGKIIINKLEANKTSAIIAYENIEIEQLKEGDQLLIFSQLGEIKVSQKPGCELLSLISSDIKATESCPNMKLDHNYWPSFRIIASKLP